MKKRQSSSRTQSSSPTSESSLSPSSSPSPELHHHHHGHDHHHQHQHQNENIPFNQCSKSPSSEITPNSTTDDSDDPQPSTIAEADRVEKMQLAKLQDRKTRIRYGSPNQCPCCGRITPGNRHIA